MAETVRLHHRAIQLAHSVNVCGSQPTFGRVACEGDRSEDNRDIAQNYCSVNVAPGIAIASLATKPDLHQALLVFALC